MNENPYIAPQADLASGTSTEPAPALWNPNSAALWSMLLSPVFGAFLHMRNWKALGEPEKAARSRNWVIGTSVSLIALLLLIIFTDVSDLLTRLIGFCTLIGWYLGNGKVQIQYVNERFGSNYPRKSWVAPLLIGFAIFAVLMFGAGILMFFTMVLSGPGSENGV